MSPISRLGHPLAALWNRITVSQVSAQFSSDRKGYERNDRTDRRQGEPHCRVDNHTMFVAFDFRFDSGGFKLGLQLRNGGHKIGFIVVYLVAVCLQFLRSTGFFDLPLKSV